MKRKPRKRKRASVTEPEKFLQAVQGVAAAAIVLHKVVKPQVTKWRERRRVKKSSVRSKQLL